MEPSKLYTERREIKKKPKLSYEPHIAAHILRGPSISSNACRHHGNWAKHT